MRMIWLRGSMTRRTVSIRRRGSRMRLRAELTMLRGGKWDSVLSEFSFPMICDLLPSQLHIDKVEVGVKTAMRASQDGSHPAAMKNLKGAPQGNKRDDPL